MGKNIKNRFALRLGERTPKFKKLLEQKFMQENQVSSILEHTANDGKIYETKFYNSGISYAK